jgi:Asp-tRNA(Asn)/Glu-tRNA(Gln) amidotransferase B subunit
MQKITIMDYYKNNQVKIISNYLKYEEFGNKCFYLEPKELATLVDKVTELKINNVVSKKIFKALIKYKNSEVFHHYKIVKSLIYDAWDNVDAINEMSNEIIRHETEYKKLIDLYQEYDLIIEQ